MRITGGNPIAVVDHHNVTVPTISAGEDDDPVRGSIDRNSLIGRNIETGMLLISAAERVTPRPETIGDVAAHRPAIRSRREFDLVPVENIFDLQQLSFERSGRLLDVF